MNLRVDANLPGSLAAGVNVGQQGTAQTGTFRGEDVKSLNAPSGLGAAAEEISFAASEGVEKKTHAQRNVKAGAPPQRMTIAQITEYLNKARQGNTTDELVALARQMLRNTGQNPGQLARQSQSFRSPTDQYLVLQYAREMAVAEGASPSVLGRIDDALGDLQAWYGNQIRTDLSTIDSAARYADTAQEVRNFQGSVQVVLGKPTLAQALQEVLQLAGKAGGKLESALNNMMSALGACLSGTTSAAEKVLLETLVTDLYHLKAMKTLLEDSKKLLKMLKRQPAGATAPRRRRQDDNDGAGGDGDGQR